MVRTFGRNTTLTVLVEAAGDEYAELTLASPFNLFFLKELFVLHLFG
jgi:hypothetical protein